MTEGARGVLLMSVVISVTLGPAWTADNVVAPDVSAPASVAAADQLSTTDQDFDSLHSNLYEPLMDKRAQYGFHGMRGKKDFDSYLPLQEWSKRASMGFHGMRGKKWEDDVDKRGQMGFHGMRGKKWYDYEDKRAMGFHGMRGKKDDWDDEDVEKRAQMGFHGMRGKKEFPDHPYGLIPLWDEEDLNEAMKRASMGFHGMRGKKDNELMEYDYEKRGLAQGFHGMRGKKSISDETEDVNEVDKRGSMGYRGRKEDLGFKRAMGFLGMRGKKDTDWAVPEKRPSHNSGFHGMRGKKESSDMSSGSSGSGSRYVGQDLDKMLEYLSLTSPAAERSRRDVPTSPNSSSASPVAAETVNESKPEREAGLSL